MNFFTENSNTSYKNETENENNGFNVMVSYVNVISVVLAITFFLGILLNIISIIAILTAKKLKPINLLILNLGYY